MAGRDSRHKTSDKGFEGRDGSRAGDSVGPGFGTGEETLSKCVEL